MYIISAVLLRTPYEVGTKEMDAQGGFVTCPKTHSQYRAGYQLRQWLQKLS